MNYELWIGLNFEPIFFFFVFLFFERQLWTCFEWLLLMLYSRVEHNCCSRNKKHKISHKTRLLEHVDILLNVTFTFCVFILFFFPSCVWTVILHDFTVRGQKNYSYTIHALFTGPTILFTHLKIILLQCFPFSVFNFSKNKFNPNGPIMIFF